MPSSRQGSGLILAAAAFLVPAMSVVTEARKLPACPDGRFVLDTSIPGIGSPSQTVPLVLSGKRLTIADACVRGRIKVLRSKRAVRLVASWGRCTGIEGKVRLSAEFDGCDRLEGRLRSKKGGLDVELRAHRSRCGDAVLDPGAGEICEANADCRGGEACSQDCLCEPAAVSSTTTVTSTSSTTTTTCVVSGSSDGATAAEYIMFSGVETGDASEACATGTCNVVTSPVRSGTSAFQIPLKSFARLRPKFAVTTLYVRIYHRVDVMTPPTGDAFTPIVVSDVEPQGIAAVDVVVEPDGDIRYALRDRLGPGRPVLHQTASLASGQWRRIELRTTIGVGTGVAELSIDGEVEQTVTGMDFGTSPLDAVFLSNNPNQYPVENDCPNSTDDCARGGTWTATFDDVALTLERYPGAGRIVARQARPGVPSDAEWTVVGAGTIAEAWSNTPPNNASRAETPASATPVAQTILVAPFSQGVDPICQGSTVKVCQTWLHVAQLGPIVDGAVSIRRRVAGGPHDAVLSGLTNVAQLRSDGLDDGFWTATGAQLDHAEIGAVWTGGRAGTGARVNDAWLVCEHQ